MSSSNSLITFDSMFDIPRMCFRSIGIKPYPGDKPIGKRFAEISFLYKAVMTNYIMCVIFLIIYIAQAIINFADFSNAAITTTCLLVSIVSVCKVGMIFVKRSKFHRVLHALNSIFPVTEAEQISYNTREIYTRFQKFSKIHAVLLLAFVWSFNLFPILRNSTRFVITGRMERISFELPYPSYCPLNCYYDWLFVAMSLCLWCGSHTVAANFIGADQMLLSIVLQVSMHFDHISKRIIEYKPRNLKSDLDFVALIVHQHNRILLICKDVDEVFSNSSFSNYLGSSFIICLVALRMTIDGLSEDLIKLVIYLFSMIFQVYMLAWMGDLIITSSSGISKAIYQHNWYDASVIYRKSILFVMMRAQKPVHLTANYFAVLSLETFKSIMTAAYQFYALLQKMYAKY